MKGHVFVPGRKKLCTCQSCGKDIPGSYQGNYKWCSACLEKSDKGNFEKESRRASAGMRRAVTAIRKRIYDKQVTHWNIKDGKEALKEKFPDVYESTEERVL